MNNIFDIINNYFLSSTTKEKTDLKKKLSPILF